MTSSDWDRQGKSQDRVKLKDHKNIASKNG
jgi:hypothetical protein